MQRIIILIIYTFLLVGLNSCKSNKEKISILSDDNLELQMIDAYNEGLEELNKNGGGYRIVTGANLNPEYIKHLKKINKKKTPKKKK